MLQVSADLVGINQKLRDYEAAWDAYVDAWLVVKVCSPEWVYRWSLQAEHAMHASGKPGMSDEQVALPAPAMLSASQRTLYPIVCWSHDADDASREQWFKLLEEHRTDRQQSMHVIRVAAGCEWLDLANSVRALRHRWPTLWSATCQPTKLTCRECMQRVPQLPRQAGCSCWRLMSTEAWCLSSHPAPCDLGTAEEHCRQLRPVAILSPPTCPVPFDGRFLTEPGISYTECHWTAERLLCSTAF